LSRYRVAVNLEITSKCNARCAMCPRDAIPEPRQMAEATFHKALERITADDVFRVVVAGYGEPTTHGQFEAFVDAMGGHPVRFDMVSNGQLLSAERLERLDGAIDTLIVSFSSVDPKVYAGVHVGLDRARVMANIRLAHAKLRRTRLAISLSPTRQCLDTFSETIAWFKGLGIDALSMSPTLYDRAGALNDDGPSSGELRRTIRRHGLRSQELDFIPSIADILAQRMANRFKCTPRNSDLLISAQGDYMYCFNDIAHRRPIGGVFEIDLREALERREKSGPDPAICADCTLGDRYRFGEMAGAALAYLTNRSPA